MKDSIYDEERGPVWGWATSLDDDRWYGSLSRDHAEQEASEQEDENESYDGDDPDSPDAWRAWVDLVEDGRPDPEEPGGAV